MSRAHAVWVIAALALCADPAQAQVQDKPAKVEKLSWDLIKVPDTPACPPVLRFHGEITASTPGVVSYRIRSSDGSVGPTTRMRFQDPGSRVVSSTWPFAATAGEAYAGWRDFEILSPAGVKPARADFQGRCAKEPMAGGRVGLGSAVLDDILPGRTGDEDLLQAFIEHYIRPRGYTLEGEGKGRRLDAFERLERMRRAQGRHHRPAGWADRPEDVGAPGATDASMCAWSPVGPTNINGRVTHIAIDPTNNQRLFVTTVGGVWRSTDGGRRWQRVSEDFLATVFASVAVNPATPTEVFAGGGDPNYHSGWRGGLGIWRSTTSGDFGTWAKVSPPELDGRVVYRLVVDTAAPNNVYAATSAGVYLGTRSGATITFARLSGFDAWTNDIAVDLSATPRLVYAGVRSSSPSFARGVWKFDGTSWNQRNTGIPTANSRTIALALAGSSPATLYAKVESDTGHLQGIYKTTTAGETPAGGGNAWSLTAGGGTLDDSGFGSFWYSWYNSVLEVDPADANVVWGGGLSIYRTGNGGGLFTNVWNGTDAAYPLGVHADQHAVAFDPANSKIVYAGNDGGIFRTSDTSLATWRWNNLSHGMQITEFYRLTSQQANASLVAGGSQDNGTDLTFGNRTWYQPGGCDGYDVAVDAANASTLYANCNGWLYELANPVPGTAGAGASITWSAPAGVTLATPLITDPTTAGAALAAGYTMSTDAMGNMHKTFALYRTTDGTNWAIASPTLANDVSISAVAIAPSSAFLTYYLGSSGAIWRTSNSGGMWTQASTGLPAGAWINAVAVDRLTPSRALAAMSGGVLLTTDTGATWNPIGGSGAMALPTTAITGAVFDPNNANVAYLSTDIGVFRGAITPAAGTTPPSAAWTPFDEGLPDGIDVNDIWANNMTGVLRIGTMGYGGYQRDIRPGITCPGAMVSVRDNVHDRAVTPSPSGVPDPEHPIPDPLRPGFYKPDDTGAGRVYWWSSTDIRIDMPATAPVKNQIANADHVEVQTCPIHLSDCPAGTIRDADAQRGQTARVYANVSNVGLLPASNVRVVALFADASAGLPLLPADFWTMTFPAGSTTCGALDTTSGWRFADPASPCRVIPVVNPALPEAVGFDWSVPSGQATHSCMFVIAESASDPLASSVRATNERDLGVLVPNNRQITLRNLHVVDATTPAGGLPGQFEQMNVRNPDRERRFVDLLISRAGLAPDAVIGLLLPTSNGVRAKGLRVTRLPLNDHQQKQAADLKLDTNAVWVMGPQREAQLHLPIPPGHTWRIGFAYHPGKIERRRSVRWSVLARQANRVIGGNTYIIRAPRE